jgi:hypothetical protein
VVTEELRRESFVDFATAASFRPTASHQVLNRRVLPIQQRADDLGKYLCALQWDHRQRHPARAEWEGYVTLIQQIN